MPVIGDSGSWDIVNSWVSAVRLVELVIGWVWIGIIRARWRWQAHHISQYVKLEQ